MSLDERIDQLDKIRYMLLSETSNVIVEKHMEHYQDILGFLRNDKDLLDYYTMWLEEYRNVYKK